MAMTIAFGTMAEASQSSCAITELCAQLDERTALDQRIHHPDICQGSGGNNDGKALLHRNA